MVRRGLGVGALALCALLLATPAFAQDAKGDTFNLQLFRPSVDSKGYFTVNASQILGHLDFSIGLVGTYAHNVLKLDSSAFSAIGGDGAMHGNPSFRVSDFITAQVQGALGLYKWVEVGVSLPVH